MEADAPRLDHENLDVYRVSIEFLTFALGLIESLPRGEAELSKQLRAASMSVPLNIAEGTGKPTVADRARFYAIARGSAMECGALLDVLFVAENLPVDRVRHGKAMIVRVVSMLTKMCR
jgi:four helix bundle protein